MRSPSELPRIFEYGNYRDYLRAYYSARKTQDAAFSYRFLARAAGFSSPNFLQLVIEGRRNLSPVGAERVATALRLRREEAAFFRDLVRLNQARTADERRDCAERLVRSQSFRRLQPLRQAQFEYYARWYFVAVRELSGTSGFREDPAWIARRLRPAVTVAEARDALEKLQTLGLLTRDSAGRLVQAEPTVSSGDEVSSAALVEFHRQMIRLGADSLERFPRERRDVSTVTVCVSATTSAEMKARIQRFRKELLALAERDPEPTEVFQWNCQFFPLSGDAEGNSP
jgi:uncharacterized protein (TIGR02147 family)